MPELSVVMPAHNEGEHIEACVDEWVAQVLARIPGAELIVVDDCSSDDTGARLAALTTRHPALRTVRTPMNVGHGRAVRLGLEQCAGTHVFQTDSDRQHRPEDFWPLWERRHDADFVFGVREHRADGAFRALVSLGLRGLLAVVWGRRIRDANCPFKLMRRNALEALLPAIPRESFIPMVMVSVLARHRGYAVCEVPVRHLPRTAGQQSLKGLLNWARTGACCAHELVALRRAVSQGPAPQGVGEAGEP